MRGFMHIATAGTFLLLSHAVASAATIKSVQIGDWTAGAYSNDATGKFSHCAAVATYRSNISLVFAIDKSYQWSFALGKDDWHLTKGARYPSP